LDVHGTHCHPAFYLLVEDISSQKGILSGETQTTICDEKERSRKRRKPRGEKQVGELAGFLRREGESPIGGEEGEVVVDVENVSSDRRNGTKGLSTTAKGLGEETTEGSNMGERKELEKEVGE